MADQHVFGPAAINAMAIRSQHGTRPYVQLMVVCAHGTTSRDDYDIDPNPESMRAALANLIDVHRREVQQPDQDPCTCPVTQDPP